MALSGTLNSGNYEGRYIQFTWSATQDITNNKSTISWSLKGAGTGEVNWYYAGAFKVIIDGTTVYNYTGARYKLYNGTSVASGTKEISHNSDGSRSFSVRIEAGIYTYAVNCTGETTFTLNTIPRASSFVVSNASVDMGTAVTFTITRASTAFTHKLTLTWGGEVSDIGTGIATSKSWTPPLTLASDLPNSTSSGCIITCITYNGSTEIGRKTLSMTLKVPSSVVPTISNVAISEATSGLAAKFGAYIQNKSTLKVVTTAAGAQSSTIKSYSTRVLNKTYSGSTITTDAIGSSGSVSVAVTVTDSRGRTATSTKTVSVTAYTEPTITNFTVERCLADGTLSDEGEYVTINYAFNVMSLNNKNDKNYTIAYKIKSETSYTNLTSGSVYVADTTYIPTTVFSSDYSYDFTLTVTDYFNTSDSAIVNSANIQTAFTLEDFHSSGTGKAIGKVSETPDLLEIALPALLTKDVYIKSTINLYNHRIKNAVIDIPDTRNDNNTPEWYMSNRNGIFSEFKALRSIGFTSPASTYGPMTTIVPWPDSSGGYPIQIVFENSNIWIRLGTSATTWGAWGNVNDTRNRFGDTVNLINLSADAKYYFQSDGYLIIRANYRAGSYVNVNIGDSTGDEFYLTACSSPASGVGMVGNPTQSLFVKKGMCISSVQTNDTSQNALFFKPLY